MSTEDIILAELQNLNQKFDSFTANTYQRLSVLETKTKPLFDNGQPGLCTKRETRLTALERRVSALERWKAYMLGIIAAIVGGATLLFKWITR
jgi:hypothetical protein